MERIIEKHFELLAAHHELQRRLIRRQAVTRALALVAVAALLWAGAEVRADRAAASPHTSHIGLSDD